jgi:dATP pyrophosphohydrolase
VPANGGFWQTVTGGMVVGEKPLESLRREVKEETGLTDLIHLSSEIWRFEWGDEGNRGEDLVYAAEVPTDSEVQLNPAEHEDFRWLYYELARNLLIFPEQREAMARVNDYIEKRAG